MTDMNKIADKIQKLLALAGNNPNEEEAQEALLKAQKLMAKYNIEMNELNGTEEIKYTLELSKVKPNPRDRHLAHIIADSFACKVIISGTTNKLAFFGRQDNAVAAKSAMEFIHKVLEHGIRSVCAEHGLKASERGASAIYNAYALGFIQGLKEAMDAQTVALAIVVPEDVKKEYNIRFANATTYRGKGMKYSQDAEAYSQGKRDGRSAMDKRSLTQG